MRVRPLLRRDGKTLKQLASSFVERDNQRPTVTQMASLASQRIHDELACCNTQGLLQTLTRARAVSPHAVEPVEVVNVLGPRSVEVDVTRAQYAALTSKKFSIPLNMHKLAGEVLIPKTTVEERVVYIRHLADAQFLIENLNPDKKTLKNSV